MEALKKESCIEALSNCKLHYTYTCTVHSFIFLVHPLLKQLMASPSINVVQQLDVFPPVELHGKPVQFIFVRCALFLWFGLLKFTK